MIEKRYDIVNETCNRLIQILCLVGVKLEYFKYFIKDTKENKYLTISDTIDLLNEQQDTIEKQKRIIKSQDMEISRQYNLCLAMSGILREEFGVYDVFDRTKDKNIKKEDDLR